MANAQSTLNIIVNMEIAKAKKQLNQLTKQTIATAKPNKIIEQTNVATFQQLKKEMKTLNEIQTSFGKNSEIFKEQYTYVQSLGKDLKASTKQMKALKRQTKSFSFDFLTLIFAGMFMKQVFGGMFKSIIDNYKKITGLNSEFNKSTLKLQASFSYLKFAIANALNSPGVIQGIEKFIDFIEYIADEFADNPALARTLVGVVGALAAIGTVAFVIGGLKQLSMLFGIFKATGVGTAITNLSNFAKLGVIVAGLTFTYKGLKDLEEGDWDLGSMLKTAFGAGSLFAGIGSFFTGAGLGTVIKNAFVIGSVVLGVLYTIKLLKASDDKIRNILNTEDAGFSRVLSLLKTFAGGALKAAAAGAGVGAITGAALGGVGALPGAAIGGIIGFITFSVGYAIKMIKVNKDEIDTSLDSIGGGAAGARGEIDDFNNSIQDVNESVSVYNLDAQDLLTNQENMNSLVSSANDLLPIYTENLKSNIDKLLSQADAANKAAEAQERLNRAISKKSKSSSSSSSSSSSVSTTTSSSGVFAKTSGSIFIGAR